ncbi:MAG: ATP-dependent Clp protease ATP-binding subunit, partial [Muribaculaceae bacterium]|nr:ATP-dependent Clp protease ATP-binding subunit [Muribaculaceae bacterium]
MKRVLQSAHDYAVNSHNPTIVPQHLLMALTDRDVSPDTVSYIDGEAGDGVSEAINHALAIDEFQAESPETAAASVSVIVDRLIKLSVLEARMLKTSEVTPVHLLLAMLHNSEVTAMPFMKQLLDRNFHYQKLYARVSADAGAGRPTMGSGFAEDEDDDSAEDISSASSSASSSSAGSTSGQKTAKQDTPVLDKFGVDMTKAAAEGRLDPVVGREVEIERLAQILSRRKKNNPV